jgi:hypothetical protein
MTMRRRIEVNLDELDQIIDRSTQAPLSKSEGQKLKTAIHAMAERLSSKRTTEKTNAVLPQNAALDKPETGESTPAGHGRHSAAAFSGTARVASTHATLHSGDPCPECRRGKVYCLKESATLVRFVGHAPLEATVFEMERLRCLCLMRHRQRNRSISYTVASSGARPMIRIRVAGCFCWYTFPCRHSGQVSPDFSVAWETAILVAPVNAAAL